MKSFFKKYKEIIVYLIFGVFTTVVGWGSYALFVKELHCSVTLGNILSWIAAVVFAYVTNKLWVFESKSWRPAVIGKEIISFVASRGITGVLEIVCVPLLAKTGFDTVFFSLFKYVGVHLGVLYTDGIYSKIAVSVIVVILNYVFSKLIVFKNKNRAD